MNYEELLTKIKNYEYRELKKTKEQVKKYTAPSNIKKNDENQKVKESVKEYKEKTNYVVPKEVIRDFTIKYFAN